jgi:hypothetical protein
MLWSRLHHEPTWRAPPSDADSAAESSSRSSASAYDGFDGAAAVGRPVALDTGDHEIRAPAGELVEMRPDEAHPEAQVRVDDHVPRRLLARRHGVRKRARDQALRVDENVERSRQRVPAQAAAVGDPAVRGLAVPDRAEHSLGLQIPAELGGEDAQRGGRERRLVVAECALEERPQARTRRPGGRKERKPADDEVAIEAVRGVYGAGDPAHGARVEWSDTHLRSSSAPSRSSSALRPTKVIGYQNLVN